MTDATMQSGPIHVVLQPNLDDADTIDDLHYPPQDDDASHLEFLRNNPAGFLRVAKIHSKGHKVVLVQSRGTDPQLYIAKQCNEFDYSPDPPNDKVAREVRICTLQGAEVQRALPTGRQFAETLAYQRLERENGPSALSVLYLRYYNGGGLDGIAEKYRVMDQAVPETLVWHVLEQLCHGLRYLTLGLEPDSLVSTDDAPEDWDPIFLQDMSPSNIFMHFPSQREKNDGNTYDESFPQIILGDFGVVITCTEIEENAHYPDWAQCTAFGIMELGVALRMLCFAKGHDTPMNGPFPPTWPDRSIEELRGRGYYSDELVNVLKKWDGIMEAYGEEAEIRRDLSLDDSEWPEGWPTNKWLFDEVLPVAVTKVAQLREAGNAPPILRQEVIDQDTQAPTDLTPRVFDSLAAALAAMNGYDLEWTAIPAEENDNTGSGGSRMATGPANVQINMRILLPQD